MNSTQVDVVSSFAFLAFARFAFWPALACALYDAALKLMTRNNWCQYFSECADFS